MSEKVWKARSWRELADLSEERLIDLHDRTAKDTGIGLGYYRDELRYRRQARVSAEVERFTRWIFWLTLVVTVATIVNVVIASLTLADGLGGGSEGDALDDAAVDAPAPAVIELGGGGVGVPDQVLDLLDGDVLVEQGGDDHDAKRVRRQVGGEAGRGEPAFEHGPDGVAGDAPAGEGAAPERGAPKRR